MSKLYSPSTGGCYIKGLHSTIPDDVIEITDELFKSVIGNPPANKERAHKPDGTPYLVDRKQSADELAYEARAWRDARLASTEWLVTRHRDELDMSMPQSLSSDQFASLLTYRQELRDMPSTDGFPSDSARPDAPEWLVALVK